jgi:hypothetical protein
VFQPEVSTHPNGVEALCEVVLQVDSPVADADRFARVTGCEAVPVVAAVAGAPASGTAEPGLRFGLAGGGALTLLSPAALQARFGAAAVAGIPCGRFAALQLRVAGLERTAAWLRAQGVAFERRATGLVVPAAHACGAALAFHEAAPGGA